MEFLESFDQGFWNFLQAQRQPWLDALLAAVALLARPLVLLGVASVGAIYLAWRRRFAQAGAVIASCGGAFLLALALGALVDRPPPTVVLRPLEEAGERSSFPSVETLTATATYLGLALALTRQRPVLAGTLLLVLMIGLARAFIGSNYPSDILAGWLGGAAWALVCQRLATERKT